MAPDVAVGGLQVHAGLGRALDDEVSQEEVADAGRGQEPSQMAARTALVGAEVDDRLRRIIGATAATDDPEIVADSSRCIASCLA